MTKRFLNWLATFSPAYHALHDAAERDRKIVTIYASKLREILNTTSAVKVPNGTTKKVDRIANGAFTEAMGVLY